MSVEVKFDPHKRAKALAERGWMRAWSSWSGHRAARPAASSA